MSTVNSTDNEKITYSKTNPYVSKIIERKCLNNSSSSKKTFHISLKIDPSIEYKPGDSVGIFPENSLEEIHLVLKLLGVFEPSEKTINLLKRKNLQLISSKALEYIADFLLFSEGNTFDSIVKDPEFTKSHDWISFLTLFPLTNQIEISHFVDLLSPIAPRFYSIASDLSQSSNQLDLLVGTFEYLHHGRLVSGLGSSYLCNYTNIESSPISLFIHPSRNFHLPEDSTPIIMIGPGTGLAPFRAFLQNRIHQGKTLNWLFFGERNRDSDFYYQDELEAYEKQGFLKLSTAFSRDQERKIYVQDKILEDADLFYDWLKTGAVVYICGDGKRMATDVQTAICNLIKLKENFSDEQSLEVLKTYKKNRKIILEVY